MNAGELERQVRCELLFGNAPDSSAASTVIVTRRWITTVRFQDRHREARLFERATPGTRLAVQVTSAGPPRAST
jgi:hypothetical protein